MPPTMRPTAERKGRSPAPAPTPPLLFPPHNEGTRSCFDPPILISSTPECSDVEENEADVTFLEGPVQRGGGGAMDMSSDLHTTGLYHVVRTAGPYHVTMEVVHKDEPSGGDDRPSTSADCYGGLTSLQPMKEEEEEEPVACGSVWANDDVSGSPGKENLLPFTQTLSPINDTGCDENSSPEARRIPAWALSSESSSSIETPKRPVWNFPTESPSPRSPAVTAWALSKDYRRTPSPRPLRHHATNEPPVWSGHFLLSYADVRRIVESVLHDYAHERLILDRITTVLASTWDGFLPFAIPDIIRGLYDRNG
ncbi:uncharacterized protein LOC144005777 [Festucalex cinctus]